MLALNVLDPSMGSGHFLVEATEHIARFLVELGVAPDERDDGEADLALLEAAGGPVLHLRRGPQPASRRPRQALSLARHGGEGPAALVPRPPPARGNALVGARITIFTGRTARGRRRQGEDAAQLSMLDDEPSSAA